MPAIARLKRSRHSPPTARCFTHRSSSITPDWKLKFTVDGKPRELAASQLVLWGSPVDPGEGTELLLAGEGLLVADVIGLDKEFLLVDSPLFGPLKLPLGQVTAVLFHPPADKVLHDRLARNGCSPSAATRTG